MILVNWSVQIKYFYSLKTSLRGKWTFICDTFSVVPSIINNIPKYVLLFSGALYDQQQSKICAAPLEMCFCFWLWDFDFDEISQMF
jgi:hypothetical protein